MLNSSFAGIDCNNSISTDSLTIYNDLNPSYPKQKALIELDSRLTRVCILQCRIYEECC
jgi:hypothetical protein